MEQMKNIKSFMTKDVVSVNPDTPLTEAVEKIITNNFNGVPVVDESGKLIGILTELELMVKGSSVHLPTLLKLLGNFEVYGKDEKFIRNDLRKLISLKVGDLMNQRPISLKENDTIDDAVSAFCKYRDTNPIPITDTEGKLTGIISRYDIVRFFRQAPMEASERLDDRQFDQKVNVFLDNFEKNFLFVRKTRTYHWLFYSLAFGIIGFIVAFLMIIRINSK